MPILLCCQLWKKLHEKFKPKNVRIATIVLTFYTLYQHASLFGSGRKRTEITCSDLACDTMYMKLPAQLMMFQQFCFSTEI